MIGVKARTDIAGTAFGSEKSVAAVEVVFIRREAVLELFTR
jgi:hypothetical protein